MLKLFKFSLTNFQKRKTGDRKHIVDDVSPIDKSFPFLNGSYHCALIMQELSSGNTITAILLRHSTLTKISV